jgi:nickel/cobalt transporter (NiCoT) family protein
MSLVDSLDSILMLYSYTNFPENTMKLFQKRPQIESDGAEGVEHLPAAVTANQEAKPEEMAENDANKAQQAVATEPAVTVMDKTKQRTMSHLSIVLTIMSILLAFR